MRRILVLALAACGADPAVPGDAATAAIVLGTVASDGTGFEPMTGDQPLIPGAQGGFHVWLKYRVAGIAPGTVRVVRTVRRVADGRLILMTDGAQDIGAAGTDGWWELPAPVPSFMCPAPLGVRVNDELVRFDVTLVDPTSGATLVEGTADATPRCPADGDQAAHCLAICDETS